MRMRAPSSRRVKTLRVEAAALHQTVQESKTLNDLRLPYM